MPMQRSLTESPKKGELYITDLDPAFGREIHKKRPVLVISANMYNENTPHVVIIPISSIISNTITPEMVLLGKIKGLDKESVLLPIYIRSIDQHRLIKKVGRISGKKLKDVEHAISLVLGMVKI